MADVFISYAREDRLAAQRVAETLRLHGWSVWWDLEIPPGKTWDELIERELASTSCVVVLWSATSLAKEHQWQQAAERFEAILANHPDDGPSCFYLKNCRSRKKSDRPRP